MQASDSIICVGSILFLAVIQTHQASQARTRAGLVEERGWEAGELSRNLHLFLLWHSLILSYACALVSLYPLSLRPRCAYLHMGIPTGTQNHEERCNIPRCRQYHTTTSPWLPYQPVYITLILTIFKNCFGDVIKCYIEVIKSESMV